MTEKAEKAALVVILPQEEAAEWLAELPRWEAGRSNGYTVTVSRVFPNLADAMKVARIMKPPLIWAIEYPR